MWEPDVGLIRDCQSGKYEASRRIFEEFSNKVFRLAFKYAGNSTDAEDLTQEVFIKAFERIKEFRCDSAFSTWLYRVATSVCLNFKRKSAKQEVRLEMGIVDQSAPSPEREIMKNETERILLREISNLPGSQRLAFVMAVMEGMPYQEISKILGITTEAVKMRVSRARKTLKDSMASYLEG
jgi:RNA polymerase sigma-70 factor (ECF subfamily)